MALDVYKEWLGIPEGVRPPDHYALLRVSLFEDDVSKIRAHYKKLNAHVRKYATGQYSVESQELLNELAKAMLCLTDAERKREYDESLGREFEEEKSVSGHQLLQNWLVDRGIVTKEQVKEAEHFAETRGLSMRDAVVQMKLVDAETAAQGLAVELGYSYIDLSETVPDDSILDNVSRNLVRRNTIFPLFVDEDCLLVACAGEPTHELEEELRLIYGVPMRPVMATPLSINQTIATYYAAGAREQAGQLRATASSRDVAEKPKAASKLKAKPSRKAFSQLSEEERRQRKQMGWIMMCWTIVGAVLVGQVVPVENVIVKYLPVVLIGPTAVWYVTKVYWK